jgi:hypothetical protein
MPKQRRPSRVPTPPWETTLRGPRAPSGRLLGTALVLLLLAVGLALALWAVARGLWEQHNRPNSPALQVGEATYSLRYFAQRLRLHLSEVGGRASDLADPRSALPLVAQRIVQEELLRRFGAELGLAVEPQEVEEALRQRLGVQPPAEGQEDPFPARYQQELQRSGLSDGDYRRMVEGQLLLDRALERFQAQAPVQAESVRYRQIVVASTVQADLLLSRLQAGEDFATLARAESLDSTTAPRGGDVGWMPRGALPAAAEAALFALAPGQMGKFQDPQSGAVYLFQVLEKDPQHLLEAPQRLALARRALDDWLAQKRSQVTIRNYVDPLSGDARKLNWLLREVYGG